MTLEPRQGSVPTADYIAAFCAGYNACRDGLPHDDADAFAAGMRAAFLRGGSELAQRVNAGLISEAEARAKISSSTESTMTVELRPVDADALLALAEWALNQPDLDMGLGLHAHNAEEAARRIESIADLYRRGIA